jgi:Na+/proline symporter
MSAAALLAIVGAYCLLLFGVAWWTSRHADNEAFFVGNRRSHWMLVAFGMVGTSLSGVTFVSVPGAVGATGFTYFQIIVGHFAGYLVIAFVLLPIYYASRVTSIYRYLGERLGPQSHRTGAGFFIVSRTLGATARLYLVVNILQEALLDRQGIPFWLTTLAIIALILAYTYKGGVKTIVWTDTLQTLCMLIGLAVCAIFILDALGLSVNESLARMDARGLSTVFVVDPNDAHYWLKDLVAGVFIAIAMTGMDQEMMQKNISVRTLGDSQKNVVALAFVMLGVVLLFLYLGGLLYLYAPAAGITATGDRLFPAVVLGHLPAAVQALFVIALVSALFPSADGALTALTSSFCIDILGLQGRGDRGEERTGRIRRCVHLAFAFLFVLVVMAFHWADSPSMIAVILKLATYTYGPLLGLFAFGILTRRSVRDAAVPIVAVAAPLACFVLDASQAELFGSYRLGLELLAVNGLITFAGLWLVSSAASDPRSAPNTPPRG